jgi:hypothetical protein
MQVSNYYTRCAQQVMFRSRFVPVMASCSRSGSTETGSRACYGLEFDPKYCGVIIRTLAELQRSKRNARGHRRSPFITSRVKIEACQTYAI